MKFLSFRPKALLLDCAGIVICYAILFQIMTHTRMIEKVMAFSFTWWELLLIASFLVARLLAYLLVPAVVAFVAVQAVTRRILQR